MKKVSRLAKIQKPVKNGKILNRNFTIEKIVPTKNEILLEIKELKKELRENAKVSLKPENAKGKELKEFLENEISKGVKSSWKSILIDLKISQSYSWNLRKSNSELNEIFKVWENLPSFEMLEKLENLRNLKMQKAG